MPSASTENLIELSELCDRSFTTHDEPEASIDTTSLPASRSSMSSTAISRAQTISELLGSPVQPTPPSDSDSLSHTIEPSGAVSSHLVSPFEETPHVNDDEVTDFQAEATNFSPPSSSQLPFVLRRMVLLGFSFCLVVLFLALELLQYFSVKNKGLVTADESKHYAWTYAPTAVFTLLSTFWARLLYYVRARIPWDLIASRPQTVQTSLFLDYVSLNPASGLVSAVRNRHYPVVASILGSMFITLAIVISSSLFSLKETTVTHKNILMTMASRFDKTNLNSSVVDGALALYAANLLSDKFDLAYPLGTSRDYAFQLFNVSSAYHQSGVLLNMTAQAEIFSADLSCDLPKAEVRLRPRKVEFLESSGYSPFLEVSLKSHNQSASADILLDQSADDIGENHTAAHLSLDGCGNSTTSSGTQCMILILASYVVPKDYDGTSELNNTGTLLDDQHIDITALLCEPHYTLERTKLTLSPDGQLLPSNLSIDQRDIVPFRMSSWDLAVAFNTTLSNSAYMYPTQDYIQGENADYANFLLASAPGLSLIDLFVPETLESVIRDVFRTTSAQIARRYLTVLSEKSVDSVTGTTVSQESRLHVQAAPLRIIEGSLIVLLFSTCCILSTTSLSPRINVHPSLVGVVEVLVESLQFMKSMTGTGSRSLDDMQVIFPKHIEVQYLGETRRGIHVKTEPGSTHRSLDRKITWWRPFALSLLMKCLIVALPIVIITSLEITLRLSERHRGFGTAPGHGYLHYVWTLLPAGIMTMTKLLHESAGFLIELLDPYNNLKQGTADIRTTLTQNYLGKSALEVVYVSLSTRGSGTTAIALSMMSAPFLTIFASDLFSLAPTLQELKINVTTSERFNLSGAVDRYRKEGVDAATISAANLLVDGMISSPDGTYDNLVVPQIAPDFSSIDDRNATQNTTVQVRLPVLRPNLSCHAIPQTLLKFYARDPEHALGKDYASMYFTYPELAGCGCDVQLSDSVDGPPCKNLPVTSGTDFPAETYLAREMIGTWYDRQSFDRSDSIESWFKSSEILDAANNQVLPCPHSSVVYGKAFNGSKELFAINCNFELQGLDVDFNYTLPDLAIRSLRPIEETLKVLEANATRDLSFEGSMLYQFTQLTSRVTSGTGYVGDMIFYPIVYAAFNGSNPNDFLSMEGAATLATRLSYIYNICYAQWLNQLARSPVPQGASLLPATIFNPNHQVLIQNSISTRLLQGLLAFMALCALTAFLLFDAKELVTKNSCSIIAQASFFADSELIGVVRDEMVRRGGEVKVEDILKDHLLSLGWWTKEGEVEKRFGIDIGKAG